MNPYLRRPLLRVLALPFICAACSPSQNAATDTPISPIVETVYQNGIVSHTVTEFRTPEPCIQALDLIEALAADVAKQIPPTGGMTPREVDRLAQTAQQAMGRYEALAERCRG